MSQNNSLPGVLTVGSAGTSSANIGAAYTVGSTGYAWANVGTAIGTNGSDWSFNTVSPSSSIQLRGENADIDINGKSLMKTLAGIEQRLGMLSPNPVLESEWKELQELGVAYRKLEAELIEKKKMWEALQK